MKVKNRAGQSVDKVAWDPCTPRPIYLERNLTEIEGARHARRPSSLAKKQDAVSAGSIITAEEYPGNRDNWSDAAEEMPLEYDERDCGWLPGPIDRPLPAFKGLPRGPKNPALKAGAPMDMFVSELLTKGFKEKVIEYSKAHIKEWRKLHRDWNQRGEIERAVSWRQLTPQLFDLWLIAKIRVAQLKPEIEAHTLWDVNDSLFDVLLASKITYKRFQFCNRHFSFAGFGPAQQAQSGDADFDSHRKRRELTDWMCKRFAEVYNPGQHLGLDDGCRAHKHHGKTRVRWKAAVHSGSIFDSLNDCKSKYAPCPRSPASAVLM